ncbi:uncharacterized protein CBL_20857 [Carabus blaptoides fortunei]
MIMSCTSVMIEENDGLPSQICIQCLQQVNRSFTFKKLCEKSDAALREFLQKNPELKGGVATDQIIIGDAAVHQTADNTFEITMNSVQNNI